MKFFTSFTVLFVISLTFTFSNNETLKPLTSISEISYSMPDSNNTVGIDLNSKTAFEQMFWVLRNDNSSESSMLQKPDNVTESVETTENISEYTTQINKIEKQEVLADPVWIDQNEMNEQIFLTRNNCNIELQINESEERKLKIQYDSLRKNISGQCQTAVYGKRGILLALLVTDIQFSGKSRNHSSEMLRVVSRNKHFNFTLIEYHGNEQYYPVILTDSDRVFLVFYFNATSSSNMRSGFNLEIFNYYKKESPAVTLQHDDHYGYSNRDVNAIFLTTKAP